MSNNMPSNLKFAKSHEWVMYDEDSNTATVGISDHAQSLLGDLVFVELPELDNTVKAGEECCVVESVKAASDVYAPVSGRIIAVNNNLESEPEQVNNDPYNNGWLFKLDLDDKDELNNLMTLEAYESTVAEEA